MSRRALVAGACALAVVLGMLLWSPWSEAAPGPSVATPPGRAPTTPAPSSTPGPSPTPEATTVDDAAATAAVCALAVAAIRPLTGTARAEDTLSSRIAALTDASTGRPALVPLLTQAEEVLRLWRQGTETRLARLDQTYAAVPPALRTC